MYVNTMEPVQIKIITDIYGDPESMRRFLNFVIVHKPDVVAMEMLTIGEFNRNTAKKVTEFYGDEYLELAENMHDTGLYIVGLEQRHHRPFLRTIGGTYKNAILRSQGCIEQEWLDSLTNFSGKKVVIFCGPLHATVLRKILNL